MIGFSFAFNYTDLATGQVYSPTPFIFNALDQGYLDSPIFSVALGPMGPVLAESDLSDSGVLSIGGLPPDVETTGPWAETPVVGDQANGTIGFWTIVPDGFFVKSKESEPP